MGITKGNRQAGDPHKELGPPMDLPDSHFLKEGEQTRITPAVREYADRFPGSGLDTIAAIVADIGSFRRKKAKYKELETLYSSRTAEQILEERKMYLSNPYARGAEHQVQGCIDVNVALCAVLRAKGIPAKFVRGRAHSTTHFKVGDEWMVADPLDARTYKMNVRNGTADPDNPHPGVYRMDAERKEFIGILKKKGEYAEGLDAWDLGIRGLKDYWRYHKS